MIVITIGKLFLIPLTLKHYYPDIKNRIMNVRFLPIYKNNYNQLLSYKGFMEC